MSNKIDTHPSLVYAPEIAEICKPLKRLNITYFGHAKMNKLGFSAITNNPGFYQHYLRRNYYNFDINQSQNELIKNYFIWDSIKPTGQTAKMDAEANEFGIKHTFTIIENYGEERNYYHFANDSDDTIINQVYLTNIDLLEYFIMYFKEKINDSPKLSSAYNVKFAIDKGSNGYQLICDPNISNMNATRDMLMNDIYIHEKYYIDMVKTLSIRDMQILLWLHKGKTVENIAKILNLAYVTINKRVHTIKAKFRCYNQFQLGEKFRELISNSDVLIKYISNKLTG